MSCEAVTFLRSLPSCQLTLSRTSRTLFFKVSMKVFAWPCKMPPSGPARSAAAPPPCAPCAPGAPLSTFASPPAAPAMPPFACALPPCPPTPSIVKSCAGSSCTSGLRICALHA